MRRRRVITLGKACFRISSTYPLVLLYQEPVKFGASSSLNLPPFTHDLVTG